MKVDTKLSKSALAGKAVVCASLSILSAAAFGQAQISTFHNDVARTGLNPNETVLTPSNVKSSSFGMLFSIPVYGQVYAQPLYLPNLTIPGKGVHNVVFIATERNCVYAYDADNNAGSNAYPLWRADLGTPVPWSDIGAHSIDPVVGVTSTPAILTTGVATPILFVVAETKAINSAGQPVYAHTLHALSVTTGAEQLGGPLVIGGSVPSTGDGSSGGMLSFAALNQVERASLLLTTPTTPNSDSLLFISFASLGDIGKYHGWVFVYDANKLTLKGIFNDSANAASKGRGGFWAGGAGPASDGSSVYLVSGNGDFDPSIQDYGDSVIKLNPNSLVVSDYFTPSDQASLADYDTDLGSGGAVLLPRGVSGSIGHQLLVQCGKTGTIYLLDTSNLGKYGTTNSVVQQLPNAIGGVFGSPAYFNGTVYFGPINSPIEAFPISNGLFTSTSPTSYSPESFGYPGSTPSISANGTANGIVWDIQSNNYDVDGPSILHAFDATNLANELYDSSQTDGRDEYGSAVRFSTPTIANGKVYAGAIGGVGVFGLGTWPVAPGVSPAGGTYSSQTVVTLSEATKGSTLYYTLDGSSPTPSSAKYTSPITISQSTTLTARAFFGTEEGSPPTRTHYLISPAIGNGAGLSGAYYKGQSTNPTGTPTATRIDPKIDFSWNGAAPVSGVPGSNWAAVWTGTIEAETTATYTFSCQSDDGVLVSVGGQTLINDYTQHGEKIDTATMNMVGGQRYAITIKYFQSGGTSLLHLWWAAPGLPQQIVPQTQLYPASS